MRSKRGYVIGLCLVLSGLGACSGMGGTKKEPLTITDVAPKLSALAGTPLDAVKQENITYAVTGNPTYDKFFKDAAIAYGGFAVARKMSEEVSKNLKGFATSAKSSAVASEAMREQEKKKELESMTVDEADKILKEQKKKQGKLQSDVVEYAVSSSHNVVLSQASLKNSVDSSKQLLPQAQQLLSDAKSAFQMWESPGVTKDLQDSVTRLTTVTQQAVPLASNLAKLTLVLTGIAGESAGPAR